MKNRSLLISIGLLTLTTGLLAQGNQQRLPQQSVTKGSSIIHEKDAPPPFTTLYTNLGSKTDTYDDSSGWTIAGPNSEIGIYQDIANPWTPSANSTIQGLQLALQDVSGSTGVNAAAIAIFSDSNGLPGNPIKVWNVQNLSTFGTCCTLATVRDAAGVKVTAGTQYWIVAGTNPTSNFYGVWDYTWNQSQGTVAFRATDTSGSWSTFTGTQDAYAIYGTTP